MVTQYVKVNGKTYPIKICQEAIMQMAMDEGLSSEEIPALKEATSWPVKRLIMLILYSIQIACEHAGKPCPLEMKDIRRAISEDSEFQADITKVAKASTPVVKEDKKKETTPPPKRKSPPR